MPSVELIYDSDCPHVARARENLLRAFNEAGLAPRWREWDRADPATPAYARAFGSPAVLVNGRDVAGARASDAACCRLYGDNIGAPPVMMIASALSTNADTSRFGRNTFAVLPALGSALLPNLVCPLCWTAYTALLSAFGVGFINYSPYLLPLTVVFLGVALATLFYSARKRGGYAPFVLASTAAILILIAKFYVNSDAVTYVGVALLVAATGWNIWPRVLRLATRRAEPT